MRRVLDLYPLGSRLLGGRGSFARIGAQPVDGLGGDRHDLARFGLLLQQGGVFEGRRLLPEGWVRAATTPSGPQPEGDLGYGATLWLMQRATGVPADTFAAMGNRGQYVIVVPSRGVVLVRRGEDPTGKRFDPALFTAAVLTSLDRHTPPR